MASVLAVVSGFVITKTRRQFEVLALSSLLLFFVHSYWAAIPDCFKCTAAVAPVFVFGFAHALLVTSLVPSIRFAVDDSMISKAFIFFKIAENSGLIFTPILIGFLRENTERNDGYFSVNLALVLYSAISLVIGVIV